MELLSLKEAWRRYRLPFSYRTLARRAAEGEIPGLVACGMRFKVQADVFARWAARQV